jgi:hypothetical protein
MPGAKVKGGYTLDVVVTTGRTYHLQATTIEEQVATPLHRVRSVVSRLPRGGECVFVHTIHNRCDG